MPSDEPGLSDAPSARVVLDEGDTAASIASPLTGLRAARRRAAEEAEATASDDKVVPSPAANGARVRDRDTGRKQATKAKAERPPMLQARKVRRIIRRIDAWSVLKFSLVFYLCVYVVLLVAGILLWNLAASTGVIDNIESFVEDLGAYQTWRLEPNLILKSSALGGAVLVIVLTGVNVLAAVLFNLISDLIGGIRVTVVEEDSVRPVRPNAERSTDDAKPAHAKVDEPPVEAPERRPGNDLLS